MWGWRLAIGGDTVATISKVEKAPHDFVAIILGNIKTLRWSG